MSSTAYEAVPGWEAFAKRVGSDWVTGEKILRYQYRGLNCEIFINYREIGGWVHKLDGPTGQTPYTCFRAFLTNEKGLEFKLFRPSFFRLLFGRFYRKDVQPDNREFNGLAEISSNNEVLACLIFSDESLQERIMDALGYILFFVPLPRRELKKYGEGTSVLVFELPVKATSAEKLHSMNLLFTQLLDRFLDLKIVNPIPPEYGFKE